MQIGYLSNLDGGCFLCRGGWVQGRWGIKKRGWGCQVNDSSVKCLEENVKNLVFLVHIIMYIDAMVP